MSAPFKQCGENRLCVLDRHSAGTAEWWSSSQSQEKCRTIVFIDIGAKCIPIRNLVKTPGDVNIDDVFDAGVLFSTYTTLVSKGRAGNCTRLEQIVEWCNADGAFDGVIVFDESHKAKSMNVGDDTKVPC